MIPGLAGEARPREGDFDLGSPIAREYCQMAHAVEKIASASTHTAVAARGISYRDQWRLLIAGLAVLDAAAVLASLSLAYLVRLSSGLLAYHATYEPATYRAFLLASIPIWLAIFALAGLYRPDNLLGGLKEYAAVVRGCAGGVLALIVLSFFAGPQVALSRGWVVLAWGTSVLLVSGGRFAARRVAYALRRRGYLTARVLIVGANAQGIAMAEQWLRAPASGMAVVGFLDDFKPVGTAVINGLEVLGRPAALDAAARRVAAQEVVVVLGAVAWESLEEILRRLPRRNGYTVRLSPGFYATLGTGVVVNNKSFVPLLTVNEARLTGPEVLLKWLLDMGLGLVLSLAALPLMALIAAGLKWAAPAAPLLDRHRMLGLAGVPFTMWKFHTPAAGEVRRPHSIAARLLASGGGKSAGTGEAGKRAEMPLLIRTGLDKLPQLFNVLAGQMSLVGPRPKAPGAESSDPGQALNLQTVKPGIIGPWTIRATWVSGDEAQDELSYVRNWTIWLDLQVIVQTSLRWLRLGRRAPSSG